MPIPYSDNLLVNPTADDGVNDWERVSNVSVVSGGVDEGNNCFRFEPKASFRQTVNVAGLPPDIKVGGYFLPARDISSVADVKAQIVCIIEYGDGSTARHVLPSKSFLWGVY